MRYSRGRRPSAGQEVDDLEEAHHASMMGDIGNAHHDVRSSGRMCMVRRQAPTDLLH